MKLSKSQFIKGHQCPKALWLYLNRKDLRPEVTPAQQKLFDQGHEVGDLAQKMFPGGVEIKAEYWENEKAVELTEAAIRDGEDVLFEATAAADDGLYARIDILKRVGDEWDLIEVKSSTGVKGYHLWDLAAQRYAFEGAGYKIRKTYLMCINNEYVRAGDLEVDKLFKMEDITKETGDLQKAVKSLLPELLRVREERDEPEIGIGDHCKKPFDCDFKAYCWAHVPEYSVYNVTTGNKRADLLNQGILKIEDIPEGAVTGKKIVDVECFKSGETHVEKGELESFLDTLVYPLYYLDYETIAPAVPIYDGTSPYKPTPFQFSCHIVRKPGADYEHVEFLHDGDGDPREAFIQQLIKAVGSVGSIVAYNASYEKMINDRCREQFPMYAGELNAINKRFVDLLVPFRSRHLYHRDMKGSASLKAVLPTFEPGLSYNDLEIGDGGTASSKYEAICKGNITGAEKERTLEALREYCLVDTLGMVKLVEVIEKITGGLK